MSTSWGSVQDRREDILVLAEHFRVRQAQLQGKPLLGFSPAVRQALVRYAWPGNVRELENVVEYLATMASGPVVEIDCLPTRLIPAEAGEAPPPEEGEERLTPLSELERKELERGLALYGTGEKAVLRIAADLGVSRATVYRRLHHYGLMSISD
ncbi:MAG: hypothetical protein ACOY94_12385 [Bacillota bacterium]